LTEALLDRFESSIESLTLIPGGGGVFEVTVDGDLIFSKKALGRHAEIDEVLKSFKARV
jgi:selenoprotein W-related protein